MNRPSPVRRCAAVVLLGTSDVIRSGAILAIVVVAAASVDPGHMTLDAPWPAVAVIVLALFGVERLGLALRNLAEAIEHPAPPYTPRTPLHPALRPSNGDAPR